MTNELLLAIFELLLSSSFEFSDVLSGNLKKKCSGLSLRLLYFKYKYPLINNGFIALFDRISEHYNNSCSVCSLPRVLVNPLLIVISNIFCFLVSVAHSEVSVHVLFVFFFFFINLKWLYLAHFSSYYCFHYYCFSFHCLKVKILQWRKKQLIFQSITKKKLSYY